MKLLPYNDVLKKIKTSPFKLRIAMILGIAGILLIMLSELLSDDTDTDKREPEANGTPIVAENWDETYKLSLEKELKTILEQITGVGECTVMITVEGTEEYVYAENTNSSAEKDGTRISDRYESNIVFTEKDGEKQALVRKMIKPQVSGILVVCEGGGDARINERVIIAASRALGVSTSKICVEESKKK